jgi:hypothetical protein
MQKLLIPPDQASGAFFSPDRQHRYLLWRTMGKTGSSVLFIGLNPSTADETANDPTIQRCLGYARDWGCSRLLVANLFSFCATKPEDLKRADFPVGPDNDTWLASASQHADLTVVAWGNNGRWRGRQEEIAPLLVNPQCLGITKLGAPRHPLYVTANLVRSDWAQRDSSLWRRSSVVTL